MARSPASRAKCFAASSSTRRTKALALPYEQAQTRKVPRRPGYYNLSTHFPWIGMRTAQLDGAHVEFHRGIRNPIGIKLGPAMTTDWLLGLLDMLDPEREPGQHHADPPHGRRQSAGQAAAARRSGARHGSHGAVDLRSDARQHGDDAARHQDAPLRKSSSELEQSFEMHSKLGSRLGGVHIELTGDDSADLARRGGA